MSIWTMMTCYRGGRGDRRSVERGVDKRHAVVSRCNDLLRIKSRPTRFYTRFWLNKNPVLSIWLRAYRNSLPVLNPYFARASSQQDKGGGTGGGGAV